MKEKTLEELQTLFAQEQIRQKKRLEDNEMGENDNINPLEQEIAQKNPSTPQYGYEIETNYALWGQKDYWTLHEAIALFLGIQPKSIFDSDWQSVDRNTLSPSLLHQYDNLFDLALRGITAGSLKIIQKELLDLDTPIKPVIFIQWLQTKGLSIPQELKGILMDCDDHPVDQPKHYQNEKAHLELEIKDLKEKCKALQQTKSALIRSQNTSDQIIYALIEAKFQNNSSKITHVVSAMERQGLTIDQKTIRARYARGAELLHKR